MNRKTVDRIPHKGERVRLLNLDMEFTIRAVRTPSRVVDLQVVLEPHAIMNDVPWHLLIYPSDENDS